MRDKYITKQRLEELEGILSDRDKAILRSLQILRYLTTGQIRRLHYTDNANPAAGHRMANWGTAKLHGCGLIKMLERRIGGVRGGSSSYVWTLAEAGVKLLRLTDADCAVRKRNYEPSLNFVKHALEVSEIYIRLKETCKRYQPELIQAQPEPACWRSYTGADGKPATMKPDLFAVTVNGGYEDRWFIEVDMDTESPCVVLKKCLRYIRYCKSGAEQKETGVFPLVLWVAPTIKRAESLRRHIADCRELTPAEKTIFSVIHKDNFEAVIREPDAMINPKGEKIA